MCRYLTTNDLVYDRIKLFVQQKWRSNLLNVHGFYRTLSIHLDQESVVVVLYDPRNNISLV